MSDKKRTRRSFLALGAGLGTGLVGWQWLSGQTGLALEWNGRLWRALQSQRPAPLYPSSEAVFPTVNGDIGITDPPQSSLLSVEGLPATLELSLEAIQRMPRQEFTTQIRCVEGWSKVVTWAGARLADLPGAAAASTPYVAATTPDGAYYVGLDLASALHPQTLLCYEMNGAPLLNEHGAPLRLVIPVKYGFKWLKRLGRLVFTSQRPPDYWAERGYDWYSGL